MMTSPGHFFISPPAVSPFDAARQHFVAGISHYEAADYGQALLAGRVSTLGNLGATLVKLGQAEAALAAFQQALALGGDAKLNGYFIGSLTGQQAPSSPPRQHVTGLFDDYAEHFDKHLVSVLGYQAHWVLIENLLGVDKTHYRSALDLGCGPLVRGEVDWLEGVDLSSQTQGKARALRVYDDLVQADVSKHLQETSQRHDLLLSCDVFIYVGALEAVFAGAARRGVGAGAGRRVLLFS